MENILTLKLENPKDKANIFSKLFFVILTIKNFGVEDPKIFETKVHCIRHLAWMIKFCYKGTKKTLEITDLYKARKCDQSANLTYKLEKNWKEEVAKAKLKKRVPSLTRAIVKTFFWKYMVFGVLQFFYLAVFRSLQPTVLAYFIHLFSDDSQEDNRNEMYISGSILVLQSFFVVMFMYHLDYGQTSIGMRVRIAVSSLIYRKMLRLNKKSLGETAAGQLVNLLSNDVSRFDMVVMALHFFWVVPLVVLLVAYLTWREVEISSLTGVFSMILLTLPVQIYLGKMSSKLRLRVAKKTDVRVKLMNELISGIRVIKMYAWEKPFEYVIKSARKSEIDQITKAAYLQGFFTSCFVFVERLTLFFTLTCYVLLGNPVTADKVFSLGQFLSILQAGLALCLPMAISLTAETLVSIERLQNFLVLEEKTVFSSNFEKNNQRNIVLKNISASWHPETPTIKNFDLNVSPGTLCAIVGPVGAGKSSILQLLLQELAPQEGTVEIGGTVAYSSQDPWLFSSSVRRNILFGQDYDQSRYRQVVEICALEKDFQQFPQGDVTIVGEKGVSLSGGQRARINLARAVYREADIYLLDDPLSAVDTEVGKHLFEKCILTYLKNKTRILVTHQLQYLKKADLIVVLNKGQIEAKGTFDELTHINLDFTKLVVAADETADEEQLVKKSTSEDLEESNKVPSNKPEENLKETASSKLSPFREYMKASGNPCSVFVLLTVIILAQVACSGVDYWVTFWTQQEAIRNSNDTKFIEDNSSVWYEDLTDEALVDDEIIYLIRSKVAMYVYGILIAIAVVLALARTFGFFKMAMNASRKLHANMFHSLLNAPMRFFDSNPSGRVLNRFSKDMGTIDEFLPKVLIDAMQIMLVVTGILVMILIGNYYMVIPMVILGTLFVKMRSKFVNIAKDVKLLEGMAKSPVFSHLNSSFDGITTIRALGAEGILSREFDLHQDAHTAAWSLTIATRVCFGIWLDMINIVFIALVIYGFVILTQFGQVSGSLVGLAISQSLVLTGMVQYGMRQTAEVINQLTTVERVLQYTCLEDENKSIAKKISEDWPKEGSIEFKNVSLRYSSEPVLRNLNFFISPGRKIGIVGRTGAGKSSMVAALFRLAPTEGNILIDKVDTKDIELSVLRRKISIIPQEPVLFSATLRYNLDPFDEFKDKQIWDVLEEVELKEKIQNLDAKVAEGGSNFSVGERQLLCLARAILRNNKILVLDEATANVDHRTDSLIQATIRRKFHDCTVLTIAHRLNTVMDSDEVLVMDSGQMVEFDCPHLLLQNKEGFFSKMVAQTGNTMAQQLKDAAAEAYLQNKK